MIFDSQEGYEKLVAVLDQKAIKYLVHGFSSGAKMIDVWHKDSFYVFQIERNFAGISLIDESGNRFDTNPDMKFFELEEFLLKLGTLF